MAGGRGRRLEAADEKPLVPVGGRPMIDRVLDALLASRIEDVYAVSSPAAPATREHVDVPCIETAGGGYVADLEAALAADCLDRPVLTVSADLPLLAGEVVNGVVRDHDAGSLTVAVPVRLKEALGVSVDDRLPGEEHWAPTGLNVVDHGNSSVERSWDVRLAVNVNRQSDLAVAERLAGPRKN